MMASGGRVGLSARPTRGRGGRAIAALASAALALAPWGAPAWAAFASGVQTSATSFASYTVPSPTGIRCSGLGALGTSSINWNAVTPPPGNTIAYVVTAPGGGTTTTSATSYQLPAVSLTTGQYKVQARISSGWLSLPATITVGLTVLLLYTCSTP
jgi:hypothetical protein